MIDDEAIRKLVIYNPYLAQKFELDNDRQLEFLSVWVPEAFYGGAAGGGKSAALLAAAAMFVHAPGYSALLLRRTFADLSLARSLIPLSLEWWTGTDAKWNAQEHRWTFPSGAIIQFGYMETDQDKYRYQSSAWTFIGFDELTQFTESQYTYLFSRLRKLSGLDIPLRMRSASNPGGIGHEWVRKRFVAGGSPEALFVAAKLADNPHLDADSYRKGLAQLSAVDRMRLEHGDWDVATESSVFDPEGLRRLALFGTKPGRTGAVIWFDDPPVDGLALTPLTR